jgi:hypothetical protein
MNSNKLEHLHITTSEKMRGKLRGHRPLQAPLYNFCKIHHHIRKEIQMRGVWIIIKKQELHKEILILINIKKNHHH